MPTHPSVTPHQILRDDYAELIDLYLLRIVCRTGSIRSPYSDRPVRTAFERSFGDSCADGYKEKELGELLALRLQEVECNPPRGDGPLFENIERLGSKLGLSPLAKEIVGFRVLVRTCEALENALNSLNNLSESRLARILGLALNQNSDDIEHTLDPGGALLGSALVTIEPTMAEFLQKISLLPGLPNALLRQHESIESLITFAVDRAAPSTLSAADYPHLRDEMELICRYLQAAMANRLTGVNVLLYGPPGVGKSQLARLIAQLSGYTLYEVASTGHDDNGLTVAERYAKFRFNQRFFSMDGSALILFDEVDEALQSLPGGYRSGGGRQTQGKAWINKLLEDNPVPAIWIANSVEEVDPAIIRRFDCIVEVRNPPRSVRRRILGKTLEGFPVTPQWLDQEAAEDRVTPALAARAARVLRAAGAPDTNTTEAQLRQLVDSNLKAQGYGMRPRYPSPGAYNLDFVNASVDLGLLCENLAKQVTGKLLLYGPPGSGKTAFAHHLAAQLDRPLITKRASDIITPYIGETEMKIAGIFHEARAENAVLLLDEADSFLQDRQHAVRSWEVTQVNELLTQMECFHGFFVCATNFRKNVDSAALRRFGIKVEFNYLNADQRRKLYLATLVECGFDMADELAVARAEPELARLNNLTPGDFTAAKQRLELLGKPATPQDLVAALTEESKLKPDGGRHSIGFAA